ncbi:hypothetical protein K1T71_009300 [Dendrolimus kikuchii]|uniref:Uncharacterized protein n=1 Tax=Dendrolimus kikuchii TaxID=765133 RepID=A0ACC1CU27_9NEOP|nr:hypothetical protein K1T71_009300 [Dendrolimus kikuchii]
MINYIFLLHEFSRQADVVMSVEMDYFNWNVSYPAIVICPSDKIDEDALLIFVNQSLEKTGLNLEQYIRSIATVSLESVHNLEVPDLNVLPFIKPEDYAGISALLFKKFEKHFLSTSFNWPISVEDSMTEMGMCHIINSNVASFDNPSKWSDSELAYTKNNIELSFHDRDFYVEIMNYADSYKVYTSNPDDITLCGSDSITLDMEGFLSFGVQISSTRTSEDLHDLSINLRKCRFHYERYYQRYPFYTYNVCLLECRIKMILKLCGCVPHFYKPLAHDRICNLDELRCLLYYKRELMTLSASNETLDKFDMNIKGLPRTSRNCGCLGNCDGDVYQKDREDFLSQDSTNRVRISITKFPKVRVMREIIFSFYDIILRSGGVVNLCIGTSFISIMELILIVIRYQINQIIQLFKFIYLKAKTSVHIKSISTRTLKIKT